MPYLDSLPDGAGPPAVFKRRPDVYKPWAHMSEALMNGPSPFTPGERELLLAFAAGAAGCDFVRVAHAAVAHAWGLDHGLVDRLLETCDWPERGPAWRPLLLYVAALGRDPGSVTRADVEAVLAAGWPEDALHDAVAIAARAAFMQRLVQGYGFEPLAAEVAASHARKRVEKGYVNLYPAFRPADQPDA